jgi:5'-nucleotidase
MVPLLNATGIDAACLGNHDLDFGMEQFEYLSKKCTFPWLVANVLDPALGEGVPLGNCKRTIMLTASNGIKVGIIGLVEREWLATLNSIPPNLKYLSASATAAELAPQLREQGAEIVIAISHQRQPNDEKLAHNVPEGTLDLILGGHDHTYNHCIINGIHLLRSGTDFKQLSYLEGRKKPTGQGWDFDITRRDIVASIAEDQPTLETVVKITSALKAKMEKPIGWISAPLDARFTTVRLKESNMGNFVCDLMRLHYDADCCIMAAGTVRGDQVYPAGVLKVKDIMNCFPFEDPCVVIEVSGQAIVEALENGVSTYPALEGRFPQVSGIRFAFDPSKEPGSRCSDVEIAGKAVDLKKAYKLCTREYMVRGKDGFTSLLIEEHGGVGKSIVDEENGLLISIILRQYFMSLKVLGRWKNWSSQLGQHWGGVHNDLHSVHPVREPMQPDSPSNERKNSTQPANGSEKNALPSLVGKAQVSEQPADDDGVSDSEDESTSRADLPAVPTAQHSDAERKLVLARKVMRHWWKKTGLKGHPAMCAEVEEDFGCTWTKGVAPRVEGRIRCLGDEVSGESGSA